MLELPRLRPAQRLRMPGIPPKLKEPWLLAALAAALSCVAPAQSSAQNSRAGRVVGNIDGIGYDGSQFQVSGWACRQGNADSIAVHIYADRSAYDKQPGTFVTEGKADLESEPAVGQACQDP